VPHSYGWTRNKQILYPARWYGGGAAAVRGWRMVSWLAKVDIKRIENSE